MACYLDNSATTRPTPGVVEAMRRSMEEGFFNPSALYAPALEAEKAMRRCREAVAKELGADTVYFTSGGTEANNLAIRGILRARRSRGRILFGAGEHPSVQEACLQMQSEGYEALPIPYNRRGLVDLDALRTMMDGRVEMLCVMQVNSETGAVQPLADIAGLKSTLCPGAHFHVDGVQGFLRLPLDMGATGVDSYALSAHKIHGPKGVGALALRGGVRIAPILFGGGQEGGIRSGTENTPGIAGLLAAIETYPRDHGMQALKMALYEGILSSVERVFVNGPQPDSREAAPHIINLSFPPVRAETLLHALEGEGVYVGNGSACSAKKKQVSRVLTAMNVPVERAESALRFSLNPFLTMGDMRRAAEAVARHVDVLKRFSRR